MPRRNLESDLTALLNSYSLENESNTPDFILAEYLVRCLDAYNVALTERAQWYGRMDVPGRGSLPFNGAMKPIFDISDDEQEGAKGEDSNQDRGTACCGAHGNRRGSRTAEPGICCNVRTVPGPEL